MQMMRPNASSQTPTGYAASHCRNCKAGWTRTGIEGGVLTVCLLDRLPVLSGMQDCDRYQPRQDEEPDLI
jgi:hypothetical protein